jgi:tetratricopeptide (TPR) repeat protein
MENHNHEGSTEPQAQMSNFTYAPPVSASQTRREPEFRVVVIPIGLLVSLVSLVAFVVSQSSPDGRAQSRLEEGNSAYDSQSYDYAIDRYDEAIRLKPDYGEAYNNRGLAYQAKGSTDQAIADFAEAIRLNPGLGEAYYNRGLAYQAKGSYDQAIADFDEAVKFMVGAASVYNSRGLAYSDMGEYDKAIADFGLAIEHDLFHMTAAYYDNRGSAFLALEDYDAAIADFDAAIRVIVRGRLALAPDAEPAKAAAVDQSVDEHLAEFQAHNDLPLIYVRRGFAYLSQDNLDQAFSDLDRAITLQPSLALAYLLRGVAYRGLGDYDRAIDDFQAVLTLDNDPEMQSEAELQLREMGVQPGFVAP